MTILVLAVLAWCLLAALTSLSLAALIRAGKGPHG